MSEEDPRPSTGSGLPEESESLGTADRPESTESAELPQSQAVPVALAGRHPTFAGPFVTNLADPFNRLARLTDRPFWFTPGPYGAAFGRPLTAWKLTVEVKDALEALRDVVQAPLDARFTQPEMMQILVTYAALDVDRLVAIALESRPDGFRHVPPPRGSEQAPP